MGKVVSLRPFIVHAAVSVEMMMLSIQANLVFGLFDTKEDGLRFAEQLEAAHIKRHQVEIFESAEIFTETGLPTAPYLDVYLGHCDVIECTLACREAHGLIPPGLPDQTESKLGE